MPARIFLTAFDMTKTKSNTFTYNTFLVKKREKAIYRKLSIPGQTLVKL